MFETQINNAYLTHRNVTLEPLIIKLKINFTTLQLDIITLF